MGSGYEQLSSARPLLCRTWSRSPPGIRPHNSLQWKYHTVKMFTWRTSGKPDKSTPMSSISSYQQPTTVTSLSKIPKKKNKKAEMEEYFSLLDLGDQKVMQQPISATLVIHVLRTTWKRRGAGVKAVSFVPETALYTTTQQKLVLLRVFLPVLFCSQKQNNENYL